MLAEELIKSIDWEKTHGLIPVIVQSFHAQDVLMLGYMNADALKITFANKKVTFFSRTKQRLWQKGEISGNFLEFISCQLDCDQDTLLIQAVPQGPTCHKGFATCFTTTDDEVEVQRQNAPVREQKNQQSLEFLQQLEQTILARKLNPKENSYTSELFSKGINKIAQKVGEEGVETVIAGLNESDESLIYESGDLIYHLLILLAQRNIAFSQVMDELQSRSS